ncbi:MAG: FkbM family methyltransferase [Deltaproteobacteria bacterium]|nr:FkbM family methyltransferase [Deltaproteobacteria bacterium]
MNDTLTYIGTDWGGWTVDLDLIPSGSTVLSAGLANDFSFDVELIRRKGCFVVGVDPTGLAQDAYSYFQTHGILPRNRFSFVQKALYGETGKIIRLGGAAKTVFYQGEGGETAETVSLRDLLDQFQNISVLKMDIEGSEYSVLQHTDQLKVPQICIEFHHWLNREGDQYPSADVEHHYSLQDTKGMIYKIKKMGYKLVHTSIGDPARGFQEGLFIRSDLAERYKDISV